MVCKKCGCDAMMKSGDWYTCPICGAQIFDTSIEGGSATMAVYKLESEAQSELRHSTDSKDKKSEKKSKKSKKSSRKSEDKKENTKDNEDENEKSKKSKLRENIEFFIPIIVAVILAILLKTFVFANAVVPTGSMLNTIQEKDRIIASRLAYKNADPERYDIVIFRYPDNEDEIFVKRVIGLPGETVTVKDGVVLITGTDGKTIVADDSFITNCKPEGDFGPFVVPEDSYFMMGDNRNSSWDSRYWDNKFVHKSKILGKVMFRYYPHYAKLK